MSQILGRAPTSIVYNNADSGGPSDLQLQAREDAHSLVLANNVATQNITASPITVVFEVEQTDNLGEYDPVTGLFTATVAGRYAFNSTLRCTVAAAATFITMLPYKNAASLETETGVVRWTETAGTVTVFSPHIASEVVLAAGDTLGIRITGDSTSTVVSGMLQVRRVL